MTSRTPTILALDLEGTLISNAMSQIPRPGLHKFLVTCRSLFPRIVMFTTVAELRFRDIARLLTNDALAPSWFADIEYVNWHGATKDLRFIPRADPLDAVLVDDFEKYIHPGQEGQWIRIEQFESPYLTSDTGFENVMDALRTRLQPHAGGAK